MKNINTKALIEKLTTKKMFLTLYIIKAKSLIYKEELTPSDLKEILQTIKFVDIGLNEWRQDNENLFTEENNFYGDILECQEFASSEADDFAEIVNS